MYTHNWGLFLALGCSSGCPCWYVSEDRRPLRARRPARLRRRGLLYLPWLPTLLHQIKHTGAPWLNSPNFGAPVQISKALLGGGTPTVALCSRAAPGSR